MIGWRIIRFFGTRFCLAADNVTILGEIQRQGFKTGSGIPQCISLGYGVFQCMKVGVCWLILGSVGLFPEKKSASSSVPTAGRTSVTAREQIFGLQVVCYECGWFLRLLILNCIANTCFQRTNTRAWGKNPLWVLFLVRAHCIKVPKMY